MKPLVSIIIPVYNSSSFLPRFIDVLLAQTYTNIEMIFIDDASTDNSYELLLQYAKNDSRIITVERTENSDTCGVPRNDGLDIAKGKYIMFVDPDDLISPKFVEVPLKYAMKYDADIVRFDYVLVENKNDSLKTYDEVTQVRVLDAYERQTDFCFWKGNYSRNPITCASGINMCTKLYKQTAIGDLRCDNTTGFEDLLFNAKIAEKDLKYITIDAALYVYIKCESDVTLSSLVGFNKERLDKRIVALNKIRDYLDNLQIEPNYSILYAYWTMEVFGQYLRMRKKGNVQGLSFSQRQRYKKIFLSMLDYRPWPSEMSIRKIAHNLHKKYYLRTAIRRVFKI